MRYARNPAVLWRSTSKGPVVLLGDGEPARLGGMGAAVWEVLDEPMDSVRLETAVGRLVGRRADVAAALAELAAAGLVRIDAGPAASRPPGLVER